jgi:hypothetical protein
MKTKTRFLSLTLVYFILGISVACVMPSFVKPALTPTTDYEQTARASMARLGMPTDTGHFVMYHASFTIDLASRPIAMYKPFNPDITPDLVASDFVISTDITSNSDNLSICGIWIRSDERLEMGDRYDVVIGRDIGKPGLVTFSYFLNGKYDRLLSQIASGTALPAAKNGVTDQMVVSAVGSKFDVYINGKIEGSYRDYAKKLSAGRFAFEAWQKSGTTTCTFKNTWVWLYK